jgi:hypothetical protein
MHEGAAVEEAMEEAFAVARRMAVEGVRKEMGL